jgi:hypothetical protein
MWSRFRRRFLSGAVLAFGILSFALPASAQVGASCTTPTWSTFNTAGNNYYCYSGTFVYPAYQFGSANGASCSSTLAGEVQWSGSTLQLCDGTNWDTIGEVGGVGAAGSTTQLQYNNSGVLGGTAGLTWNSTNDALTLATIANPASSALTITGGALTGTTSYPALNITQTWNNAGGTFTGILENVTNTLSVGTSKLIDLQVGGTSKFNITGAGNVGIGTTSPSQLLSVGNSNQFTVTTSGVVFTPQVNSSAALILTSSGGETLTIQNFNDVIYTTGPFDFFPSGNASQPVLIRNSRVTDGASSIGFVFKTVNSLTNTAATLFKIDNQSTNEFTVMASGNVGIGTTAPTQKVTVYGNIDVSSGSSYLIETPNAGTTGTTANTLAKLNSSGAAVIASTMDIDGMMGVVVGGAGITGNAQIAVNGQASCVFDGATTAGDYVTISSTATGDCHDSGASRSTTSQTIGHVLTTNASTGTYMITLGISSAPLLATSNGTTPSAFSFTNQTGVNTSTTITSNAVTLIGFTGTITATCGSGCTAIAHNGTWGGTTVTGFQAGDSIAIQQISSASIGTATNATVTAGSTLSTTWTVTTTSSTPSAFSFTNQAGDSTSLTYSSNAVTLSGFTGTLTATCTACTSIANNGVWGGTTYPGFVSGNTIAMRVVSSAGAGSTVTATAMVGATTSTAWTVTTATACQTGITIGQTCPDGTIYAGTSPDTSVPMYTTPCDAGQYWNGSSCSACTTGLWSGSGSTCGTTYSSSNHATWNNGTSNWTTTGYTSQTTGKANTAGLYALVDAGSPYNAADYCATLPAFGHSDWYLPALNEVAVLYANKTVIGNFDITDGNTAVSGAYPGLYWSSSEYANAYSYTQRFSDGFQTTINKTSLLSLRCVRR